MRDPNDTRDIGPRIGSPLWNYITAVTVAGLGAFLVAVHGLPGSGISGLLEQPLLWVIAALALLGELKRIVTPGKSGPDAGAVSVTFCFAALLYWGFPVAAVLRAITTLVVALSARRAPFRAFFNVAQLTLSLAAAAAVLAIAHVHPTPPGPGFRPGASWAPSAWPRPPTSPATSCWSVWPWPCTRGRPCWPRCAGPCLTRRSSPWPCCPRRRWWSWR